jgi:LuxR family maltose regulon positive regulatory protein
MAQSSPGPRTTGAPAVVTVHSRSTTPGPPTAHLPRPELSRRLRAATAGPLTLVVAPAGHGKTTAVADVARSLDTPVAWIALDRHERSSARAWARILDGVGHALGTPTFPPGQVTSTLARVRAAARWLSERAPDLLLVLDDEAELLAGAGGRPLDVMLDGLPSSVRVVVASRAEPACSIARHRAGGRVTEFGIDDLRFDRDEVHAYLGEVWRLGLPPRQVDALVAATEGWPAVLHLVAGHMARLPDPAACDPPSRLDTVQDYVRGELLRAVAEDDVDFLTATLDLSLLLPGLVDATTGRPDGRERLARVAARGLVVPRTGGGHRHHTLVRDALDRQTPRPEPDPAVWPALLDAHLLAGDGDRLEAWLDRTSIPDTAHRRAETRVQGHLARLRGDVPRPGPEATFDPVVQHATGTALAMAGRHREAGRLLERALLVAVEGAEELWEVALLADLALERALAGRLGAAEVLGRRARRRSVDVGLGDPPPAALVAAGQVALDRRQGDVATSWARRARDATAPDRDLAVWTEASLLLGRVLVARGDTLGAGDFLDEVHVALADRSTGAPLTARVARAEAALRLTEGDLASLPLVAPELLAAGSVADLGPDDRLLLARILLRRGRHDRAAAVAEAVAEAGAGPRQEVAALRVVAAACGARGDLLAARRARRAALTLARGHGLLAPPPPRAPQGTAPTRSGRPRVTPRTGTTERPPPSSPAGAGDLTERELAVLRQLPLQLSNPEIARRLYVSVNTVKSHLKSIYRKLGVASRRDAITRARALDLL